MTELKLPTKPVENWERVRDEWVGAVEQLVGDVEGWCKARDWPTRRIDKKIDDTRIGEYVVPALLIQVDLVKVLLEPVARFVHKWEGVVDLYRMPEYGDVATLYRRGEDWQFVSDVAVDKPSPGQRPPAPLSDAASATGPFTAETFAEIVRYMA